MQMAAFHAADITPPPTPSNLVATVVSSTEIDLSWATAPDDVNINSFFIEQCQGASCSSFAVVGNTTATSFANTALSPGTSYSYRVRAVDGAQNPGTYSSIVSKTTSSGCTSNSQCGRKRFRRRGVRDHGPDGLHVRRARKGAASRLPVAGARSGGAPSGAEIVVVNSGVRHSLASSEYNKRRAECDEGVRILASLRNRCTDRT